MGGGTCFSMRLSYNAFGLVSQGIVKTAEVWHVSACSNIGTAIGKTKVSGV